MSYSHESFPYNSPMDETDRGIIEAQIEAGIATAIPEKIIEFAGNFIANLPGGVHRSIVESNRWFDRLVVGADESDGVHPHSERARSVTWQTFFDDVDEATKRSGVDPDELERLRQARLNPEPGQNCTPIPYVLAALPIYLELRVMGYSHYDLQR